MSIIRSVLNKFKSQARYRKAVEELSRLSDRELLDLGLTRYDIHTVAREAGAIV